MHIKLLPTLPLPKIGDLAMSQDFAATITAFQAALLIAGFVELNNAYREASSDKARLYRSYANRLKMGINSRTRVATISPEDLTRASRDAWMFRHSIDAIRATSTMFMAIWLSMMLILSCDLIAILLWSAQDRPGKAPLLAGLSLITAILGLLYVASAFLLRIIRDKSHFVDELHVIVAEDLGVADPQRAMQLIEDLADDYPDPFRVP